jgi:hypothetical protein
MSTHPVSDNNVIAEILRRLPAARNSRIQSHRRTSGARLRRIHDVVRAYLTHRARQDVVPRNPASHIELPAGKRPEGLVWTDERVEHWLRTSRAPAPSWSGPPSRPASSSTSPPPTATTPSGT